MKPYLYTLLAAGGLLLLASAASASPTRLRLTEIPAEGTRRGAARERVAARGKMVAEKKAIKLKRAASGKSKNVLAKLNNTMLVMLGMEKSKRVTSPLKLTWHLHRHQQMLKMKARQESRAHRARCIRQMN